MISRRLLLLDRLATVLVSLALIAGGAAAVWWWTGAPGGPDSLLGLPALPERSDTGVLQDVVAHYWYPWASAAAGVLLVLLGLKWLGSHVTNRKVTRLALPGSTGQGKLTLDASGAADAAADALSRTPGVRSARGIVTRDRGELVARIRATLEPEADLGEVAAAADTVAGQLADVVGREELRCRVELTVARTARGTTTRVA